MRKYCTLVMHLCAFCLLMKKRLIIGSVLSNICTIIIFLSFSIEKCRNLVFLVKTLVPHSEYFVSVSSRISVWIFLLTD